jgi:hypothetical protein
MARISTIHSPFVTGTGLHPTSTKASVVNRSPNDLLFRTDGVPQTRNRGRHAFVRPGGPLHGPGRPLHGAGAVTECRGYARADDSQPYSGAGGIAKSTAARSFLILTGEAVPLSHTERARLGGRATGISRTQEQKKEIGRRAYLASAVKAVVDRAPDLTPDQLARLRTLFAPAVTGAGAR